MNSKESTKPPVGHDMASGKDVEHVADVAEVRKEEPPDGGPMAWLQTCSAFSLVLNCWGLVNSFGAFQSYYQTVLLTDRTASEISWIGSLQTFLLLFGGIYTASFFDKGYLRPLILLGSFFIILGMMLTSICTRYWQFMLAQGLLVGLGYGCFMIPTLAVVPQYFKKNRALAMGIGVSGGSLGGIVYTILFQRLVPVIGFGWTVRLIAFIALTTLVVPVLAMRWKASPKKMPFRLVTEASKDVPFMIYVLSTFFGFMGLYIPFFYIQLYALSQGDVHANLAPYLIPVLSAGSLLGRVLPSYLADRVGPLNMSVICTSGAAVTAFSWISVSTEAEIVIFALFFGFFTGGFIALGGPIVPSLAPDLGLLSVRFTILFLPASLGVLIGNPIAGALSRDGWLPLQLFCGAVLMVSSVMMAAARVSARGFQLWTKV